MMVRLSIAALLLITISRSTRGFFNPGFRSNLVGFRGNFEIHATEINGAGTLNTLESIKSDVEKYMSLRNAVIADDGNSTSSNGYEKYTNPLEMFKPTGWYKDEVTLELASRSDKTIPKVAHPLAFAELQRFGYDNLSIPIMLLGGPHEVGVKLGLNWVEPVVEKVIYDEEKKIAITTTYLFDTRGSLKLGGVQDELMESSAAELDLSALKKAIQTRTDLDSANGGRGSNRDLYKRDADGEINYKETVDPLRAKSTYVLTESKIPRSERFSLNGLQRLYMVSVALSSALAHGRASQELLLSNSNLFHLDLSSLSSVVDVATIVSNVLVVFAIVSSSYSFKLAGLKFRNPVVWTVKGLLGGPLTALQLRDLESLPQNVE